MAKHAVCTAYAKLSAGQRCVCATMKDGRVTDVMKSHAVIRRANMAGAARKGNLKFTKKFKLLFI